MSYVQLRSCVRGFHEYQAIWEPTHGEELQCSRETDNPNDPYAVSVTRGGEVVGHVPHKISRMCAVFIRNGGRIKCTVTGNRCYSRDLPQGGMEIPCFLTFFAEEKWLNKISKLIEDLCFSDDKTEEREDGKSEKNGAEDEITEYEPLRSRLRWSVNRLLLY